MAEGQDQAIKADQRTTDFVILHEISGCRVTLESGSVVLKKGRRVRMEEVQALKLAAQYELPVPRVHDSGPDDTDGEYYIAGHLMKSGTHIQPSKTAVCICRQLRDIITIMRSIPHDTGLIGSCSGGLAYDTRLYTQYSGGPFSDEATFNSSFYFDLVHTVSDGIRTALSKQLRTDHRIVFSHGDIVQHNIMVKDGRTTALLDWENGG
ncbi:hypothetical protein OPT61_g8289 [Boeremia exigua]|uniref:Uncharacterized protein n=1 Tax=Boeremia exigua TaxID=749465 RepID=A0ACC2HZS0_9PLEO|nr:hypothetical protein OPT61_g8289 [Boeremia exigua]